MAGMEEPRISPSALVAGLVDLPDEAGRTAYLRGLGLSDDDIDDVLETMSAALFIASLRGSGAQFGGREGDPIFVAAYRHFCQILDAAVTAPRKRWWKFW